jgi:hypothetical protein
MPQDDHPLPPLPDPTRSDVLVAAPGTGPGYWAGGPTAALAPDGTVWVAYRLRRPYGDGRGYANVVARYSESDGAETVAVLERESFSCSSLERPLLVARPDGGWRLYLSCATPGTWHWRVDVLDADDPARFEPSTARTVLPGDATVGVKDPVVKVLDGRWHLWLCCHPLDDDDATDRMSTTYGWSDDGLDWVLGRTALAGTPGTWDQRGARVADVVRHGGRWVAYYDGRASKEQNAEERTGVAVGTAPDDLRAVAGPIGVGDAGGASLRYLCALALPDGGTRLFYETSRLDGAHDLRTEYVPPSR